MPIELPKLSYFELRYRVRWSTLHKLFHNPFKIWRMRRERLKYGLCEWDGYNLFAHLEPVIANGLDILVKSKHGVPAEFVNDDGKLTEEGIKNWEVCILRAAENARWLAEFEDKTDELYRKYFDKDLDGFKTVKRDDGFYDLVEKRNLPERDAEWLAENKKFDEEREVRKDELFDFMKKWFFNLWD